MNWKPLLIAGLAWPAALMAAENPSPGPRPTPPPPAREMRGAWIATVANIDWPSRPGLPVAQQKAELVALLDCAERMKLNAVFFQVRPVCDALYASSIEPWSEYLSGAQGRTPAPFYDPLSFAVTQAHARGLELHAWFNPFRAAHPEAKSPAAPNHIIKTRPDLVRRYGRQLWLDPGEPDSQSRAADVVLDVVRRYDIDGVVFDDYFYPYPEKNLEFSDDASWKKSGMKSGLSRDDWRRDNINRFVRQVSRSVHEAKPWVRFGISPFGIWRPGVPAGIDTKALDAHGKLYADARLWISSGWLDYLAPQLYWPHEPARLGFDPLLRWWRQQNTKGRHVYAAINDSSAGGKFPNEEIGRQLDTVRAGAPDSGVIHYHLRNLAENQGLARVVAARYAGQALVPAATWLDSQPPEKPRLTVSGAGAAKTIAWENGGGEPVRLWVVQTLADGRWETEIHPGGKTSVRNERRPEAAAVRAVDRCGNLSRPAIWPANGD